MYYIAFLPNLQRNVIVPRTWIKGIKDHDEKFINYGLNTGQKFTCFYTSDKDAFHPNGAPKVNYPIDFGNCELSIAHLKVFKSK